ncbi:MAG: hypothetical protein V3W19_08855 [Desulfatiglandales bacterium]
MKIVFLILSFLIICSSGPSFAENFLGAPVVTEGKTVVRTESRLEMVSPLSHDEVVGFYKKALKGYKDIKFRDWKDATYIEDDGKRPWHSITISKQYKEGTNIVIVEDNWTWIIGTLVLRYIGVFMVLLFLLLSMYASGAIISRSVKRMEAK